MIGETNAIVARIARLIRSLENSFLVGLLTVMIGLAVMQIVLRNVFDSGVVWAEPLLRLLVLWVGLAGAMVATRRDKHIAVDVVTRYLSTGLQRVVRVIVDLFTAVVSAIIAYHAGRFVWMEREADTIAFGAIPTWVCELIIPLAFGVIALRYLISALAHGRRLFSDRLT